MGLYAKKTGVSKETKTIMFLWLIIFLLEIVKIYITTTLVPQDIEIETLQWQLQQSKKEQEELRSGFLLYRSYSYIEKQAQEQQFVPAPILYLH